ncbi:MAG: DUF4256 domain-containing protein [Candidatus Promineifilaceae bacterium]
MKKASSKKIERYEPNPHQDLSAEQRAELLATLEKRFAENASRHEGIEWAEVRARLEGDSRKLWSLNEMERTGGEPDVAGLDAQTGEFFFYDCAAESPSGRRSICYDGKGQAAREKKGVFPAGNAVDMAAVMGIELLSEDLYRDLQELEAFDTKTSSWLRTPQAIRDLGGAVFGDRRYDQVFLYHNGADSFYSARGFRGRLRV